MKTKSKQIKQKPKLALITTLLTCLFFVTNAHALSATTANTIQETKPYLLISDGTPNGTKLTSLDELLGFSMWDGTYSSGSTKDTTSRIQMSKSNATSEGGSAITVPAGFTFDDVTLLVTPNDGTAQSVVGLKVGDDDGDAVITTNTSVQGSMIAVWKDGGTVVTDLTKKLTACGGPYTLELSILSSAPVIASTNYGAPNTNNYESVSYFVESVSYFV